MATRKATHAGSWYTHRATELAQQLQGWLDAVEPSAGAARAVIAPHAGFSYSGPTAAYAYKHVQPATIRRVFVLGPSHHQYLRGCALTSCAWYETPLGRIAIDADTCADLRRSGLFESMALQTDEEEHSIEMHLPYVQAVMRARAYTLVPVLVGSLTPDECAQYGRVLAPHLADPACLFVVSSDFCHWGRRFNYRPIDERYAQICDGIEALDRRAMEFIANQDAAGFHAYQKETRNTICGQNPILLLLHTLPLLSSPHSLVWVRYAQSSKVASREDSSVSYASAVVALA
ncbi:hypothetical protein KFE25_007188 [Diacronema lutheri]|uniref:Protein MEMO1 n=1 Tax=Diacronema lutheri TaxID=2081491 RepID=A0A8J5XSH0_DIALT|nr:hypothetical protein KFE25_007188 [Diacronema lutheri]